MSRSRNIKPGFFLNDALARLSPLTRIMFAGLWTVCDRTGRVLDRPARIKAEVLPYDDCDADAMLSDLARAGFIDRYVVDGVAVLHVLTWDKHQNPHIKEAASTLPCKCEHQTSTVQEQCKNGKSIELSRLIPDSGFLIPDSIVSTPDGVSPRKRGSSGSDGFDLFWAAYPRKTAKAAALKAFTKAAPSVDLLDDMLQAIAKQRTGKQWMEGFIPHPATWLNGKRWEDEQPPTGTTSVALVADPWETRAGVDGIAKKIGLQAWDECCEWSGFKARVRAEFDRKQTRAAA
mgnify:CR=1 FL=1